VTQCVLTRLIRWVPSTDSKYDSRPWGKDPIENRLRIGGLRERESQIVKVPNLGEGGRPFLGCFRTIPSVFNNEGQFACNLLKQSLLLENGSVPSPYVYQSPDSLGPQQTQAEGPSQESFYPLYKIRSERVKTRPVL